MVILIWLQVGFAMILLSSAIKGVPEDTLEAARIDGATELQIFSRVVIPQIKGTIITVFITVVILVLKVFDIVYVLTNGRDKTQVIANLFFNELFARQPGRAGLGDRGGPADRGDPGARSTRCGTSGERRRHDDRLRPRRRRSAGKATSRPGGRGMMADGRPRSSFSIVMMVVLVPALDRARRSGCWSPRSAAGTRQAETGWWTALWNGGWTFENYRGRVRRAPTSATAFLNSVIVAIPATIIPIMFAAFAAYAFTFMDFRGKDVLFIADRGA